MRGSDGDRVANPSLTGSITEELMAAQLLGRVLATTALHVPKDWDSIIKHGRCAITLLDFGAPSGLAKPTLQPTKEVYTTRPVPLPWLTRKSRRKWLCGVL